MTFVFVFVKLTAFFEVYEDSFFNLEQWIILLLPLKIIIE